MAGRSYTVVTNTPVSGKMWWFKDKTVRGRSVTHGDLSLDLSDAFLQWVTNKQEKLKLDRMKNEVYLGWVCSYPQRSDNKRMVPQSPSPLSDASSNKKKNNKVEKPSPLKELIFRTNKTVYNVDSDRVTFKTGLSKRYKHK